MTFTTTTGAAATKVASTNFVARVPSQFPMVAASAISFAVRDFISSLSGLGFSSSLSIAPISSSAL